MRLVKSESAILNPCTHSLRIKFIHLSLPSYRITFCIFAALCALILAACARKQGVTPVHIAVTMRKFAIEPHVIRVKRGQNVVLDVTSKDVLHGFQVEELGINEPIQPGKGAVIPLDTSKKGASKVSCSIVCGAGHDDMSAIITVE